MSSARDTKSCPACGFSEHDFGKTLRLGCARCYEVFGAELSTFLPKMHRATTHVGKVPGTVFSDIARLEREFHEIERLLTQRGGAEASDYLLDRWKQLAMRIEVVAREQGTPE